MKMFARACALFILISAARVDAAEPPANPVPPPGTRVMRTSFRLVCMRYEGDPKKPESLVFSIDTVDLKQPLSSLKLGEPIPNTKFKLLAFKYVLLKSPPFAGDDEDLSELTLVDVDTKKTYTLVPGKILDIPKTQFVPDARQK